MCAVVPVDVTGVDEPKVRLIDERGRLHAVPRALVTHVPPCNLMQLTVDEWNQPGEGGLVAPSPVDQQGGDAGGVVGDAHHIRPFWTVPAFAPCFRILDSECTR